MKKEAYNILEETKVLKVASKAINAFNSILLWKYLSDETVGEIVPALPRTTEIKAELISHANHRQRKV